VARVGSRAKNDCRGRCLLQRLVRRGGCAASVLRAPRSSPHRSKVVEANGGKNVGAVRVPLSTADFSSYLLQAQSSGAQVLGLANAGDDFINSLKSANEFGLTQTMKPAGLLVFVNNIDGLGLRTAQGLYLTDAWYWDLNAETRAFGQRYFQKMKKYPSMLQAGYYLQFSVRYHPIYSLTLPSGPPAEGAATCRRRGPRFQHVHQAIYSKDVALC
jgi:hypothetical protein